MTWWWQGGLYGGCLLGVGNGWWEVWPSPANLPTHHWRHPVASIHTKPFVTYCLKTATRGKNKAWYQFNIIICQFSSLNAFYKHQCLFWNMKWNQLMGLKVGLRALIAESWCHYLYLYHEDWTRIWRNSYNALPINKVFNNVHVPHLVCHWNLLKLCQYQSCYIIASIRIYSKHCLIYDFYMILILYVIKNFRASHFSPLVWRLKPRGLMKISSLFLNFCVL